MEGFFKVLSGIFSILKWVLIPILIILAIWFLFYLGFHVKHIFIDKIKPKKSFKIPKKPGILKRIFWLFPRRLSLDVLLSDPYEFKEFGLHMICGEQGAGKTITLVYLLQEWKKKYPKLKIYTNMDYKYQDGSLTHWRELVSRTNGKYGVVEVIDEIQTWFNSMESKDFPVEMLTEISQQRKQRKCVVGTAQVFSRIAKPIREQTHFVYMPITVAGCLTIVRRAKAVDWDNEKQQFKRYYGLFFFVHNDELRNSFDTFKKIERYKTVGFNINKQLYNTETFTT